MRNFFVLIGILNLLYSSFIDCYAQDYVLNVEDFLLYQRNNQILDHTRLGSYYQVQGNPYLNDGFQDGEIKTKDNITYRGPLRFDMYSNEVQYRVKSIIYAIVNPEVIDRIKLGDISLIYSKLDYTKKEKGFYFELIIDGDCQLLARKSMNLLPAIPPKAYHDPKPAQFSQGKDKYYLKKNDRTPIKIKTKKHLLEILSNKEKEIEQFLKLEKLSLSNREDLIKLVEYYNKLISLPPDIVSC